ncbi:MAG: hypothetical protein IJ595_09595, partial [Oscillospiraceae bacterium]|nr:hypothetical protein [Oscillospiraceae bacterium]
NLILKQSSNLLLLQLSWRNQNSPTACGRAVGVSFWLFICPFQKDKSIIGMAMLLLLSYHIFP